MELVVPPQLSTKEIDYLCQLVQLSTGSVDSWNASQAVSSWAIALALQCYYYNVQQGRPELVKEFL